VSLVIILIVLSGAGVAYWKLHRAGVQPNAASNAAANPAAAGAAAAGQPTLQPTSTGSTEQNERTAIDAIRTINTAEVTYASTYPDDGFAESLSKLGPPPAGAAADKNHAGLIDSALAAGERDGYRFAITSAQFAGNSRIRVTYSSEASPIALGQSGTRAFCSDQSGAIKYSCDGSGASCTSQNKALQGGDECSSAAATTPQATVPSESVGRTNSQRPTAGVRPAVPAAPAPPPYQEAHTNAEQAFAAARYIDPPDGSALYWSRLAQQRGDPNAGQIEAQVLDKMTSSVQADRTAKNYDSAILTLSRLMQLFPDRAELRQMSSAISQEQDSYNRQVDQQRKAEALRAQTKQFRLRHRHVLGLGPGFKPMYAYCEGILRITPDARAQFDCTSADPRGRCDHFSLNRNELQNLRMNNDGGLHVETRSGKFDFYGDSGSIQGASQALSGSQ
jgi:type IV pilus assembly protein PilA